MAKNQIISGIGVDSAADNGKVPVYNNTTGVFDMTTPSGGSGTNLFTADQTQTANRTHDQGSFTQTINNANNWVYNGATGGLYQIDPNTGRIDMSDATNGFAFGASAAAADSWQEWNRSGDNPIRFYSGTGSPEGVITADPGCQYIDESNANVYQKASGSATDTGWVLVINTSNTATLSNKTLSGPTILAEGASVQLDPALSADGTFTGITRTGTAGATLAFGDLCYLDPTDSRWELADANAAQGADGDARGVLGICVQAAAADGSATTMLLYGTVRADTAFPSMTINNQIYASETAGDVTGTRPSTSGVVIRVIGVALTADEILFNPSPDNITNV